MPKGAISTNCLSCGKAMKTVKKDGKATCIPCRHAAQTLSPGQHPCAIDDCNYPRRFIATGYCNTHHRRYEKHGSPYITMKGKAHAVKYTPDGMRVCSKCSTAKQDSEFHRDKNGTRGRRAACSECELAIEKSRYVEKAEVIKARQREYRATNLELVRAQEKANYERNREAAIAASTRAVHVRRARLRNLRFDQGITVAALRKTRGDNCEYCATLLDFVPGKRGSIRADRASLEHVLPISRGGTHTWDNVTLACHQCNTSKNAKTLDEWKPNGLHVEQPVMVGQLQIFPITGLAA